MTQPGYSADTIVARATAPGQAAVAIVRMSGPRALDIAASLFTPGGLGVPPKIQASDLPDRALTLGTLLDSAGAEIDQCLMVVWRAPHSYTGETVVEWHLHGGARIVEAALEAAREAGARPADPGEFTRRAFLNGRIDLAQAEAVADLVAAQTAAAARCALGQLAGGLSERIKRLRESLVAVAAEIEAAIDFPDEDIPDEDRARQGAELDNALRAIESLLADSRRGRPLREGARVAIAGRPNTGKSSLFNALLGKERAIVAPHEGTTRDTIEAAIDLAGIPTVLVDTAGLRSLPADIEAMGIERARAEIASADLVVFLIDGSRPLTPDDRDAFQAVRERPFVVVINKLDLPAVYSTDDAKRHLRLPSDADLIGVSAKARDGLDQLESRITRSLTGETKSTRSAGHAESPLVTNSRHIHLLEHARESLRRAGEGLTGRLPPELVAVDLRDAADRLGALIGRGDLAEDILDAIFLRFCIGK